MKSMTKKTQQVGELVGQAGDIVRRMWRKEKRNKVVVLGVVMVVLGIVYFMGG